MIPKPSILMNMTAISDGAAKADGVAARGAVPNMAAVLGLSR